MCRYAFYHYKNTYGCFKCQVGFKRRNLYDVQPEVSDKINKEARKAKENNLVYVAETNEAKCPNCGGEMANLGRDLRLPTKTKDEQWACIKYLVDNNYNIYSCGCQGIGFVPHKMQDAITLVAEYKEKQNLVQKQYDIERKFEEKQKAQRKREKEKIVKKQLKEIRKEEEKKK
jgi:hypothetical protein